jgi:hypothetical protein
VIAKANGPVPAAVLGIVLGLGLTTTPVGAAGDVAVSVTAVAGTDVKELRATGTVAASPEVVRAVIVDVERYASFMPYVAESRIVAGGTGGDVLNYQRLSFGIPFVSDRHYVIRLTERRYVGGGDRAAYRIAWRLERSVPLPSVPSVIAVEQNDGYWDLKPASPAAEATVVAYCVFTDPGGSLPKWIVGQANRDAIPRLFDAVRSAVNDPRYAIPPAPATPASSSPPPETSRGCRSGAGS